MVSHETKALQKYDNVRRSRPVHRTGRLLWFHSN